MKFTSICISYKYEELLCLNFDLNILSGAIYGWGKNTYGQLGLNDEINKFYPTQLKTLRSIRVKYIACGEDFSAFLSADGGVFTCGAGMYGQLGHGSNSNEILPRKIMELMGSTVTQVSCGRYLLTSRFERIQSHQISFQLTFYTNIVPFADVTLWLWYPHVDEFTRLA